ncbi:solute carrier organic anion transporter family member 4C1-like isoform X3 [Octopus vulgaris]|uniref:Solute carrier organic anion transporter family member n=2 Tax=Octopus vulgaris TaxID=6645 RepID=A0AA36F0D8_OCTVU|nr:solute carrier organic anion transporter family member 4C1-like isoform X3 [Octopus vulgaris]
MKANKMNAKKGFRLMDNETKTNEPVKQSIQENGTQVTQDEETEDLRYGFGPFRPPWLQIFNQPRVLLVILSYTAFVQGFIVNGVINANMSTVEKRFELPSSMSGWIASVYDITAAPIALFVCFKGAVNYKLRWLGYGFITFSLGSFVMALPHIFADTYTWDEKTAVNCLKTSNGAASCRDEHNKSLQEYLGVFLLGQIFHSVGGSILYSLGITVVDDIVKPIKTPFYIGIMMFFSTLGPAIGYIVGGQFLNVFVDPSKSDEINFDSRDPRWIGAWWVCFFISGSLSAFIGPVLLGYARELPVTKNIRMNRESQVHQTTKKGTPDPAASENILQIVWSLFKNPVFMFVSLASATEGIIVSGLSTYLPKFFENQFGSTPTWAALISGLLAVPSAAGGQILGGYLCKRFRLKVREQGNLCVITLTLGLLGMGIFWVNCEDMPFAGITHNYNQTNTKPFSSNANFDLKSSLKMKCNSECSCTTTRYQPVCGADDIQYFSPCFAGCASFNNKSQTYLNCSCVTNLETDTASEGKCPAKRCTNYYLSIVFIFLLILFAFIAHTPMVSIILRCIPDDHRSYGLGISSAIGRITGTFPGPILFGVAIDQACKVWKDSCSEGDTSCWIYQKETLSRNFFLLTVIVRLFTVLFLVIAKCLYKPPTSATKTNIQHEITVNVIPVDKSHDNEAFSSHL